MTDTQTTTSTSTSSETKPSKPREPDSVIIRPWPKVVFLYPVFICATLFWMISAFFGTPPDGTLPTKASWMGDAFMVVTFTNFLVFAFDFSRIKSITIIFGFIAAAFALFWAAGHEDWGVMPWLGDRIKGIDIQMNTWFYGSFSLMMGFILVLVLINTRFSYYEVNHREILHHHGYLGDVTRMPTTGLRLNKEIYDLLEFALLRSGRLIFYPSTSREAIVIDNVINVNHIENRIKDLLSVVAVRMTEAPIQE